jgi:hypothetical protein
MGKFTSCAAPVIIGLVGWLFCGCSSIQTTQGESTTAATSSAMAPSTTLATSSVNSPSPIFSPSPSLNPVQVYADPATQAVLRGLSENDYAQFIQYCNADMRAALTQEKFSQTSTQLLRQVGPFISLKFLSTETRDNYVIVHYEAKYEKTALKIRMVFDGDHKVAGQWFE